MLRHTFRGTTLKTWIGLESERDAFRRYKTIRRAERDFFPPEARAVPFDGNEGLRPRSSQSAL
jgi:hypothetical protein